MPCSESSDGLISNQTCLKRAKPQVCAFSNHNEQLAIRFSSCSMQFWQILSGLKDYVRPFSCRNLGSELKNREKRRRTSPEPHQVRIPPAPALKDDAKLDNMLEKAAPPVAVRSNFMPEHQSPMSCSWFMMRNILEWPGLHYACWLFIILSVYLWQYHLWNGSLWVFHGHMLHVSNTHPFTSLPRLELCSRGLHWSIKA